jgi:FixJ family two-component response regulator
MEQKNTVLMRETSAKALTLHFVEPDSQIRSELFKVGTDLGYHCEIYADYSELAAYPPRSGVILIRDCPETGGIDFALGHLTNLGIWLPVLAMDYQPSAIKVVEAIKSGALDYLVLPLKPDRLVSCLARIGAELQQATIKRQRLIETRGLLNALSGREREVLDELAVGRSNKEIARKLNISPRTVEIHRANMMTKLGARHVAEAIRIKLESGVEKVLVAS